LSKRRTRKGGRTRWRSPSKPPSISINRRPSSSSLSASASFRLPLSIRYLSTSLPHSLPPSLPLSHIPFSLPPSLPHSLPPVSLPQVFRAYFHKPCAHHSLPPTLPPSLPPPPPSLPSLPPSLPPILIRSSAPTSTSSCRAPMERWTFWRPLVGREGGRKGGRER